MTTPTTQYRPLGALDANARLNQNSYLDESYVADLNGGSDKIYEGWARPGTATSSTGWKIVKNTYSTNIKTRTQYPQNSFSKASNDYEFIWDNRAALTYS